MTKLQSSLDAAIEMLRDLEEFKRSGSKEAFAEPDRPSRENPPAMYEFDPNPHYTPVAWCLPLNSNLAV
jgi:hypothetical protein